MSATFGHWTHTQGRTQITWHRAFISLLNRVIRTVFAHAVHIAGCNVVMTMTRRTIYVKLQIGNYYCQYLLRKSTTTRRRGILQPTDKVVCQGRCHCDTFIIFSQYECPVAWKNTNILANNVVIKNKTLSHVLQTMID